MAATELTKATDERDAAIAAHRAALDRIHSLAGDKRQAQKLELWETSDASAIAKLEDRAWTRPVGPLRDALVALDRASQTLYRAQAARQGALRMSQRTEDRDLTTVTINEREAGWLNRGEEV